MFFLLALQVGIEGYACKILDNLTFIFIQTCGKMKTCMYKNTIPKISNAKKNNL